MNDIQDLVDGLAADLGRPVGIDDREFHSIAYSSHVDELDQVRLSSILQRQAPPRVTEFLRGLHISDVEQYLRIPRQPQLGMASRVCLPVRFEGVLLGYLWLFDEPAALTDDELVVARRFVADAAAVLFRVRRFDRAGRAHEHRLLADLLGIGTGEKPAAASQVLEEGILSRAALLWVMVLRAVSSAGSGVDDGVRVRLATAAERARRSSPAGQMVSVPFGDSVVVVAAGDSEDALEHRLERLHRYAQEALGDALAWTPVLGVSGRRKSLLDCEAAHREAARAATAAEVVERFNGVGRWDELGAYRVILELIGAAEPMGLLPSSVRRLLAASDVEILVPAVWTWLEKGSDAKRTAEALFLHRSTLYNRLHRVEGVTGLDLRTGEGRLELHLGLRLLQLSRRRLELLSTGLPCLGGAQE